MNSFAFDTHAFVKRLTHAGMEEQQAEALVEFQKQLIDDSLATKRDIEGVKASIEALRLATEQSIEGVKASIEALRLRTEQSIEKVKGEVEKLRLEMKKDIKGLELRLTLRLASVIVVTMGIFATLVKFLP